MEVEAGNENMKFETGPFSSYGVMALSAPTLGECKKKKTPFCSVLSSEHYIVHLLLRSDQCENKPIINVQDGICCHLVAVYDKAMSYFRGCDT